MLGDIASGLLLSLTVTSRNVHDGQPAYRLIRRANELYESLDRVLGDTAYGGAHLRHTVQRTLGVCLLSPPPPVEHKEGRLGKARFAVDFDSTKSLAPTASRASTGDCSGPANTGRMRRSSSGPRTSATGARSMRRAEARRGRPPPRASSPREGASGCAGGLA
ncbi:transposase [Stigmatella aurantiaca]|uniref:transposase n=1 Tax=Stigmatella aurantiaca TaxID=41 RepID=UPI003B28B033